MKNIIGQKILGFEIDNNSITMTLKDEDENVNLVTISLSVKISADILTHNQ